MSNQPCPRCGKQNVDPVYPHTCTPLALKLADALENWPDIRVDLKASAAELRRLHVEVDLQQCSLNVSRQMIEGYVDWIRKDEALLRQALDCLENHVMQRTFAGGVVIANTATALRERLGENT